MSPRFPVLVSLICAAIASPTFADVSNPVRVAASGFEMDTGALPRESLALTIWNVSEPRAEVLQAIGWQPIPHHNTAPPASSAPPHETVAADDDPPLGGTTQLHAGMFAPDGYNGANHFDVGFRGGANIDQLVQIGLGADWSIRSQAVTTVVRKADIPGGLTSEQQTEVAHSSTYLFPVTAYLQIQPWKHGLVPYIGGSGGYEVLFVSAKDYQTGAQYSATFGGWGWQAWGGVSLPLGSRIRLMGEVFRNTANVERNVTDAATGQTLREVVNVNGTGARFGLGWGL